MEVDTDDLKPDTPPLHLTGTFTEFFGYENDLQMGKKIGDHRATILSNGYNAVHIDIVELDGLL